MMEDVPGFTFSEDEIANIKASLGAIDVDESQDAPISETRPKRRGRPPGSKNKTTIDFEPDKATLSLAPAPLTKREEREVESRLVNILTGATGMAGVVKPYLAMTDEEATAIAAPLASYLIRNEATNGVAREILENYDLLAMTLGVGAYSVRVYNDRKSEVATKRPANTTATERISDIQRSDNGREPNEGVSPLVSVPNASRSGVLPSTFDASDFTEAKVTELLDARIEVLRMIKEGDSESGNTTARSLYRDFFDTATIIN